VAAEEFGQLVHRATEQTELMAVIVRAVSVVAVRVVAVSVSAVIGMQVAPGLRLMAHNLKLAARRAESLIADRWRQAH
jgi:hypothetical protein